MAPNPRDVLHAARTTARRTRKSAGRLVVSGLGFSAAYFLDAEHGKARRQQVWDLVDHVRRSRRSTKVAAPPPGAPPAAVGPPGPVVDRSVNGVRATAP
jgi:hypothetical protein